jgi:hypothetical protein
LINGLNVKKNQKGDWKMRELAKAAILKEYFSVPEKPVTMTELKDLMKSDSKGYHELAELAAKELGVKIKQTSLK